MTGFEPVRGAWCAPSPTSANSATPARGALSRHRRHRTGFDPCYEQGGRSLTQGGGQKFPESQLPDELPLSDEDEHPASDELEDEDGLSTPQVVYVGPVDGDVTQPGEEGTGGGARWVVVRAVFAAFCKAAFGLSSSVMPLNTRDGTIVI